MRFTDGKLFSDDEILDVLILIEAEQYSQAVFAVRWAFGDFKTAAQYVRQLAMEHLNKDIFKFSDNN